jgi:hypothetical protein
MKGWIFDVYYRDGRVYLWTLSEGGTFRREVIEYSPYVLVEPLDPTLADDIFEAHDAEWVTRKTQDGEIKRMILIRPHWSSYRFLVRALRRDRRAALYDDLLPVQKFLFTELSIEPGRRAELDGMKALPLDTDPEPMPVSVGRDPEDDIFCSSDCSETRRRSDDPPDPSQGSWAGRICMDGRAEWFECSREGLAYLQERSVFSFLPLGLAARWSSNRVIDSRNAYTLISRGYAVPELRYTEPVERLRDFLYRDRGGYTIPPLGPGVYFNVAVIDFESEYPNIILKNGISYEGKGWLIPDVISEWVRRRLELKRLAKEENDERRKALLKARSDSLKILLVSEYGISGCSLNRFGNHYAFEEINAASREVIKMAKLTAEELGFSVIYGDVDSLFVRMDGAVPEDYMRLARAISERVGIPAALDKVFRAVAFVETRTSRGLTAIKRYFGVTLDGEVEARGIELRRSDVPELIRNFQEELIRLIYSADSVEELRRRASEVAPVYVARIIRLLRSGGADESSLIIRKRLGKSPEEYSKNVPQKIVGLRVGARSGLSVSFVNGRRGPELDPSAYDWRKYAEMAMRAAETVLRPLGVQPRLELALDRYPSL